MSRKAERTSSKRGKTKDAAVAADEERPFSAAFLVLVAATTAAPLVANSVHPSNANLGFSGGAVGLVLFGSLILLAFLMALLGALRRGELLLPHTWLLGVAGLVMAAAISSAAAAADRHRSLVGATEVILGAIYLVTAILETRGRHAVRWLVAALIAGAAAAAIMALVNRLQVSPEDLAQYYQAHRAEVLEKQGYAPGSVQEQMLQNRFGDFMGTFYHPNLLASYLAMGVLLTLGLVIGHVRGAEAPMAPFEPERSSATMVAREHWTLALRRRTHTMVGSLILVPCLIGMAVALVMTRGRAAMAVTVAGVYLVLVLGLAPTRRSKALLIIAPLVTAIVLLTVVLQLNLLPSITSRFVTQAQYLRSTWEMILDRPWLGVGPGNFGDHYLQYKAAEATEEIDHPHCWPMWAWATMGVAGLVGVVLLPLLGVRAGLRHMAPAGEPRVSDRQVVRGLVAVFVLVAIVLSVFAVLTVGDEEGAGWGQLNAVLTALSGLLAPFLAVVIMGSEADQSLWNIGRKWTRRALLAALAAYWIEGLMSLSLPHLPTTMAAYAVIAMLVATGQDPERWIRIPVRPAVRLAVVTIAVSTALAYTIFVASPVLGSAWNISQAWDTSKSMDERRLQLRAAADQEPLWSYPYKLLAESDWTGSAAAREDGRRLLRDAKAAGSASDRGRELAAQARDCDRRGRELLTAALDAFRQARDRSPYSAEISRKMALALRDWAVFYAGETQRDAARREALDEMRRSVELSPSDAPWRIEYITLLAEWGYVDEAAAQARETLALDDAMPEALRKLPSADRHWCESMADLATK